MLFRSLLFESQYTRELIDLGHADTLARRADVEHFFGWQPAVTTMQEAG